MKLQPDGRFRPNSPFRLAKLFAGLALFLLMQLVSLPDDAQAQRNQLPDLDYYQGYRLFYDADYQDAERFYTRGARSAFKFGTRRFLDSVCYWTMMGECYYHMGNYAQAVEMYEQSLALYLTYQNDNWQSRVQLPPTIQPNNTAAARARITWGNSSRSGNVARVPDSYQMLFGRMDAERALQQGGVVQNPEIKQVDVNEIMRCLAICLHRRRVIKGPTAKFDPLSSQLVQGLSTVPIGNGTVLGAYNGVLLGIAQAAMQDFDDATNTLKRSLQFSSMDHPLTPIALLELAQIGVDTGNFQVAGQLALESSFSAAMFNQFDVIEESLGVGTRMHLKDSPTAGAYSPLANVIPWANRNDARLLQASSIVYLAECLAEAGDAAGSTQVLRQSGPVISRRSTLGNAVVSARLKYVTAVNQFSTGDFSAGLSSLSAALKHYQTGSFWLYRLGLASKLAASGAINARQADQLYSVLLRDPTDLDWELEPMESIAFLTTPHVGAMESWFDIVVARRDFRRALDISELVRRHRFFSTLPMGGRLMGFRWVMQGPDEALTQDAQNQRSEFLNRKLAFKTIADESRQIQEQLLALPLSPDPASAEARQQNSLLKRLGAISATQEAMLASLALRREPSQLAFPPERPIPEIQSAIADDQMALVTMATATGYHFFLVNKETVQYSNFSSTRDVIRGVGGWLKQLGVNDVAVDLTALANEDWKATSRELVKQFFPNTTPDDWKPYRELVVVPDGALWYVPFEALLIGEEGADAEAQLLSERVNVRYSPTLALAFGAQRPVRKPERSAVIVARMHPRGEPDVVNAEFEKLAQLMPDVAKLETISEPTNLLAGILDRVLVWSGTRNGAAYQFAPLQLGTEKRGGSLSDWMSLPWQGPEHLILPGHQAEGLGLRGQGLGNEMFLKTLGLTAAGTRSILISRWNTGGKTSLQLSAQYFEKLEADGIEKALADARLAVRESDLDFANEPRLKTRPDDPATKADHPLWWASHMLLAVPDGTALKFVPRAGPGESEDDEDGDEDDEMAKPDDPKKAELPDPANPGGEDKGGGEGEPEKKADPLPGEKGGGEGFLFATLPRREGQVVRLSE